MGSAQKIGKAECEKTEVTIIQAFHTITHHI